MCPAPSEVDAARSMFPEAACLTGLDLGAYAAVLADARAVVAVDTGPAHLAAAVSAPLVSLFGPGSDPATWSPWGPSVTVLKAAEGWPSLGTVTDTVLAAVEAVAPRPRGAPDPATV